MDVGSILTGGGVVGVFAAVVNAIFNRKKLGADTASVLTKAATDLLKAQTEDIVKPLQEKVRELEAEVAEARGEVATLRQTVRETTAELETCRAESRAKDVRIRDLEGTS